MTEPTGKKTAPPVVTPMPSPERPPPSEAKARPIPKKVRIALEAMLAGKARNLAQAAKIAGCSRPYISKVLIKRPDVVTWVQQRAARTLGIGAAAASARMLEFIYSKSPRVGFEASRHVLSLAGIAPPNQPQVSVNVEVKAGYVIDLSPETEAERQAIVERERQTIIDAEPLNPKAD